VDGGASHVVAARDIEAGEELTIDYALHTIDAS
jgi:SET domain-containing protein